MYSSGIAGENYLRGVQVADADGRVRFTSIFPACYPGRWPHVHFEVYPDRSSLTEASEAIVTSQLALPAESCDQVYATAGYERSVNTFSRLSLQTDGVFGDDAAARQLASVTGDATTGFTATLDVGVDPRG